MVTVDELFSVHLAEDVSNIDVANRWEGLHFESETACTLSCGDASKWPLTEQQRFVGRILLVASDPRRQSWAELS